MNIDKLSKYLALLDFFGHDVLQDFEDIVVSADIDDISELQKYAIVVMISEAQKQPRKRIRRTLNVLMDSLINKTWEEVNESKKNFPPLEDIREELIQLVFQYMQEKLVPIKDEMKELFIEDVIYTKMFE